MVWGTLSANVSGDGDAPFDFCAHLDLSLFPDCVICGFDVRGGVGVDETARETAHLHCCHPPAVFFPVFGRGLRSLANPAMSPSYGPALCGLRRHHPAPPVASLTIDDPDR